MKRDLSTSNSTDLLKYVPETGSSGVCTKIGQYNVLFGNYKIVNVRVLKLMGNLTVFNALPVRCSVLGLQ